MVIKSWTNEKMLEELTVQQRNGEMVKGVIRSVKRMSLPVPVEGQTKVVEGDTLIVALPNGITGYCPASEFREREYRSLDRFVTLVESFVILSIDLDSQVAILSERKAAERLRDELWEEISTLEAENRLEDKSFTGVVTGVNAQKGIVYLRIQGQNAYMYRRDWSWKERDVIDAQVGEEVEVKVTRADKEQRLLRVSRKLALPDPFQFIDSLRIGQVVAGRVVGVHKIHGLFVEVENGIELKAGKRAALEEPEVGDFVSCRIQKLDPENRRGRVVILEYPRGKRKPKDLGSFLFE